MSDLYFCLREPCQRLSLVSFAAGCTSAASVLCIILAHPIVGALLAVPAVWCMYLVTDATKEIQEILAELDSKEDES